MPAKVFPTHICRLQEAQLRRHTSTHFIMWRESSCERLNERPTSIHPCAVYKLLWLECNFRQTMAKHYCGRYSRYSRFDGGSMTCRSTSLYDIRDVMRTSHHARQSTTVLSTMHIQQRCVVYEYTEHSTVLVVRFRLYGFHSVQCTRDWKIVITGTGYLIPSVLYRSTTVICQYDGDRILR